MSLYPHGSLSSILRSGESFSSLTNADAAIVSAAVMAGEVDGCEDRWFGSSVDSAERYNTSPFQIRYVSRGYTAFVSWVMIGHDAADHRKNDAYIREISAS
jgi:hypothetical protein